MSKKVIGYLESLLDADIHQEQHTTNFIFQNERIGLKNQAEINFLKEVETAIRKETHMSEDELIITAQIPESLKRFDELQLEDEKSRWIFAYQLIEKVRAHVYDRLTLVVCPENIVYSTGMTPHFLHYGVVDRLPPLVKDEERVWLESRATVAAVVDGAVAFDEYVKYSDALKLNEVGAAIMSMTDHEALLQYIQQQIKLLEEKEKQHIALPNKKWEIFKLVTIGLGALLIPALLFTIYYFIYNKPKHEAYLQSHSHFLEHNYSQVVTVLSPQSVKSMPYIVLYELAHSYVVNERLEEEQKKNVLMNITLRTDEDYLKYWIYIGRGEAAKAVDLARSMEDGELITYGLLKRREEIQAEKKLSGEKKQQLLKEIDDEVDEYKKLLEQESEMETKEEPKQEKQETTAPQETITEQPEEVQDDSKTKEPEPEQEQITEGQPAT
ncbi:type VII secretion protein EssB [Sporosarcina sp. HYO08]|uniref:type VII secretion protein EssB n=1 Tax=Sporosarcina sp. HYO08 TaxID=1759557 RepID=UPI0007997F67|nr:type VII secretion protein EssB [Sporosarcina sp. HYO08]KXH78552.1 hypothetical protein AU377_12800 [Sporosarcina sp. HYO08]